MKLRIDINKSLLSNVPFLRSPNFNQRPKACEIDMIVIHNISLPPKQFGGTYIEDFFTNQLDFDAHPYFKEIQALKVSSHCLIHRTGELLQFVPFRSRAWHAGVSSYQGRENCNDYSIGIELEGADEIPYTQEQYEVLAELVGVLLKTYPKITFDRIVGHNEVAPDRKTDPGPAFDWELLAKRLLNKI